MSNQPQLTLYHHLIRLHFRVSYGLEGAVAVRNRFAEREAEELHELIAQLDRINFS